MNKSKSGMLSKVMGYLAASGGLSGWDLPRSGAAYDTNQHRDDDARKAKAEEKRQRRRERNLRLQNG